MRDFLADSLFFGALLTLAFYAVGLALRRRFKLAVFNPILIATFSIIGVLTLIDMDYEDYTRGADYISYFLTPATVCLAVPLYEKLTLLKKHWKAVLMGLLAGVLTSVACIFALCKLFGLSHQMYVTLLPKSITTAIGIGVSTELGGVVPLTVAAIMITGIFGSVAGEQVFRLFGIKEPVARGLGLGTASHAVGTSKAMELGEVEGAMSSLALVAAGITTVIAAPLFAGLM